jgi:hypothetical protein
LAACGSTDVVHPSDARVQAASPAGATAVERTNPLRCRWGVCRRPHVAAPAGRGRRARARAFAPRSGAWCVRRPRDTTRAGGQPESVTNRQTTPSASNRRRAAAPASSSPMRETRATGTPAEASHAAVLPPAPPGTTRTSLDVSPP